MTVPKFLADENIAAPLVSAMREAGWDVAYVAESKSGITDEAVLQCAVTESRILLTEDKGFGDLVFRMKRDVPGILMLRIPEGSWHERWARLRRVLDQHADRLSGSFVVVRQKDVRYRPIS